MSQREEPAARNGASATRSDRTGLLRLLAGLAVPLILVVWLGSLAAEPPLLQANLIRVCAALIAAGIAWGSYGQDRPGLPWQRCLAAGVGGSLLVTGISVVVPALGHFSAAGWLVSGVVGGAAVVLGGYVVTPTERRS